MNMKIGTPTTAVTPSSVEMFKLGMRRLAAGVSLITTEHQGERYGLIATSVTSLTGEPPSLLVCVNRSTSAHDPIDASRILCVNLLGEQDDDVAARFSSSARRAERFTTGDWMTLETGAPVLQGSLAAFDCEVTQAMPYGTHTIFICLIKKIRLWHGTIEPLLYLDGRYRKIADYS